MKKYLGMALLFCTLCVTSQLVSANSNMKGIYVTQYNLENTAFLNYLIKNAKAAGVNTFVVDLEKPEKRYQQNIALLKQNNIRYVARITMFPGGGTAKDVSNPAYWQRKYKLVEQ